MTNSKKTGWKILAFSCAWKTLLIVAMLHGAGCVTVDVQGPSDCGGDHTTVVVVEPPSQTPPDASDPTGPSVPQAEPVISLASVPTSTLTTGTIVAYRFTITASVSADVLIKRLSFRIAPASAIPNVQASNPHLRIVGASSDLPAVADIYTVAGAHCGEAFDDAFCQRIVLSQPLAIEAGTSVTLDLRVTVSGDLTSDDSLTTSLYRDAQGDERGPLAGSGLDTLIKGSLYEDGLLWSNDDLWFYNGHSIVGTPFAQTLTR